MKNIRQNHFKQTPLSMNDLLSFENKKERNDFLISLLVILFFGWLFWWFGIFGIDSQKETPDKEPIAMAVAQADVADQDGHRWRWSIR